MKTIILNASNVGNSNNQYQYNFPSGGVKFTNNKVALTNISIYYSWFNIQASLNNNTYSYKWINGTTVAVVMPDGFYTVSDLNEYLQSVMIANKHYLVDTSNSNVFYLEWQENAVRYSVQLNAYATPAILATGWSYPSGASWALGSSYCPQLTIPAGNFTSIVGFTAGLYPSSTTLTSNQSFISSMTPQITPITSVLMLCSLINNDIGNNQVLYSFSPNVEFGSQINITPPFLVWNNIMDSMYSNMRITLVDQSYNQLNIKDTNLIISLAIKDANE
jgi:hypothetical protein